MVVIGIIRGCQVSVDEIWIEDLPLSDDIMRVRVNTGNEFLPIWSLLEMLGSLHSKGHAKLRAGRRTVCGVDFHNEISGIDDQVEQVQRQCLQSFHSRSSGQEKVKLFNGI